MFSFFITPRVGLEPTTLRLTAECSTTELSRTMLSLIEEKTPASTHSSMASWCPIYTFKTAYGKYFHPTPQTRASSPSGLSGHALDRLVIVSSMHCCTSTSILSTSSSSRGLTGLSPGISHLEGGFTLRCLQRLSRPGLATLPCAWRRNRSTSGQSIPVLSY